MCVLDCMVSRVSSNLTPTRIAERNQNPGKQSHHDRPMNDFKFHTSNSLSAKTQNPSPCMHAIPPNALQPPSILCCFVSELVVAYVNTSLTPLFLVWYDPLVARSAGSIPRPGWALVLGFLVVWLGHWIDL